MVDRLPRSRFGREAWSLLFWVIAVFCTVAGALSAHHLEVLQRDATVASAKVMERAGLNPPSYMYVFQIDGHRFTGYGRGPNQPLYEEGDLMPVTYYRPNPRVNNPGHALNNLPLENAKSWFFAAVVAALNGLFFGAMAKYARKDYPWS